MNDSVEMISRQKVTQLKMRLRQIKPQGRESAVEYDNDNDDDNDDDDDDDVDNEAKRDAVG